MAQVNVAVEDRVLAALDRVAQAKSLSRPELLRKAIQELIEAHDAGRPTFQTEAAPRLDATVSGLVHQLRELVMELDRAQADNARMLGKLTEKWNGGEEVNRIAQEKLLAHFRGQDQASLSPFYARAEQLLAAFETLEPKLLAALEPHLAKICAQAPAKPGHAHHRLDRQGPGDRQAGDAGLHRGRPGGADADHHRDRP